MKHVQNGFPAYSQKAKCQQNILFHRIVQTVIENCNYETYFTEKITDCFANGVIPVYYGTRAISDYFDINGIIFLTDDFDISTLTKELYQSKIQSIQNNLNTVRHLKGADDFLAERIRELI